MKNTDAKSAPEGVASNTVSGGLERYIYGNITQNTEIAQHAYGLL